MRNLFWLDFGFAMKAEFCADPNFFVTKGVKTQGDGGGGSAKDCCVQIRHFSKQKSFDWLKFKTIQVKLSAKIRYHVKIARIKIIFTFGS